MNQFAPILPEIILTVGSIVLMMVAAFAGRRSGGIVSWSAVAILILATIALKGAPSNAGVIFGGLVSADLFGSFGKAVIFLASAVAIVAAHGWFERDVEHGPEYSVLVLLTALGGAVMVAANVDERSVAGEHRAVALAIGGVPRGLEMIGESGSDFGSVDVHGESLLRVR